jgi:hypothetical protein
MIRVLYVFIFLALLFSCDTASNVAAPNLSYFIKYFGQDGDQTATDLIVNSDGTFYILGNSIPSETSLQEIYIAKANSLGELIWQKTYGTLVGMVARDFLLTADGQHLVVVSNRGADALLSRYALDGTKTDSVLVSNAYANSVTELSDGSYILEGKTPGSQSAELHFRWNGSPWGQYDVGGITWTPNYKDADPNNASANFIGVNTIQVSPTTFYTFGYTDAKYQAPAAGINQFWAYHLGQYGGTGGANSDNGIFNPNGYATADVITRALPAATGGYFIVGISTSATASNLKVEITSSDNASFLQKGWVLHDVLMNDVSGTPLNLGNPQLTQYATAWSSPLYNFILANNYSTTSGKSDIMLMKVTNDLVPIWGDQATGKSNFVTFGGDGDDTAAAVAELPDGHIMVLGTMQLGNPPAQFKIVLMKLNSLGQLAP